MIGDVLLPGRHPNSEGKRRRNRSNVEAMAAKTAEPEPRPPDGQSPPQGERGGQQQGGRQRGEGSSRDQGEGEGSSRERGEGSAREAG